MEWDNWVCYFLFHFLLIVLTNFMTFISCFFFPLIFFWIISYFCLAWGGPSWGVEEDRRVHYPGALTLWRRITTSREDQGAFIRQLQDYVKHKGDTTLLTVREGWLITSSEPWQNHIFFADAAFKFGQPCQRDASQKKKIQSLTSSPRCWTEKYHISGFRSTCCSSLWGSIYCVSSCCQPHPRTLDSEYPRGSITAVYFIRHHSSHPENVPFHPIASHSDRKFRSNPNEYNLVNIKS